MSDIDPGFQRLVTIEYKKADGAPGEVEGDPAWELSEPSLATVAIVDRFSANVQHNGGTGDVTLTIRADGDLGQGVHPIVNTEAFTMKAPLGATAGSTTVGEQVAIETPAPSGRFR